MQEHVRNVPSAILFFCFFGHKRLSSGYAQSRSLIEIDVVSQATAELAGDVRAFGDRLQKGAVLGGVEQAEGDGEVVFSVAACREERTALINGRSHKFPGRRDVAAGRHLECDLVRNDI